MHGKCGALLTEQATSANWFLAQGSNFRSNFDTRKTPKYTEDKGNSMLTNRGQRSICGQKANYT